MNNINRENNINEGNFDFLTFLHSNSYNNNQINFENMRSQLNPIDNNTQNLILNSSNNRIYQNNFNNSGYNSQTNRINILNDKNIIIF